VEFLKVIGPLSDPESFGGSADDAFRVVCPSLPGYGFSGKPLIAGWGVESIAAAWSQLMARLDYDRYGAQGGDWGAAVTTALARQDPDHLCGIHLNMPVVPFGSVDKGDLSDAERAALASLADYQKWESGYSKQQSTRPQALGYGLVDSPVAQCAWIVEKFRVLDNVMVYWLTGTGASSARLYWESYRSSFGGDAGERVAVPTGCSIFPKEIVPISRRWAETGFSDIRYWNELDRGGHFAAFEQPELFVDEFRSCFRHMR
jgi:pimeloyl-ACP methyl ester carboxylesterase